MSVKWRLIHRVIHSLWGELTKALWHQCLRRDKIYCNLRNLVIRHFASLDLTIKVICNCYVSHKDERFVI